MKQYPVNPVIMSRIRELDVAIACKQSALEAMVSCAVELSLGNDKCNTSGSTCKLNYVTGMIEVTDDTPAT